MASVAMLHTPYIYQGADPCSPQEFTPWGFLAGAFFVVSMASTLFAIKMLGLSTASGVWCGTAGEFDAPPSQPFSSIDSFCCCACSVHILA